MGNPYYQTVESLAGSRELASGREGVTYLAINPTPGTGLAGHAAPTTFDETKAIFQIYNGSTNSYVYPHYLRLTITAASVGNTIQRFTQTVDTGNRFSSGGSTLTAANTNMASSNVTGAVAKGGAVVCTAASGSRRILSTMTYRTVLGVVGDVYAFSWGHEQGCDPASLITTGSAISNVSFSYNPVVIGPGQSFMVYQWAAGQSGAPSFEFDFGYSER